MKDAIMELQYLLKLDYILAFATFIVPGFIIMKIIRLKVPNKEFLLKDMIFEALAYSLINLAFTAWIPYLCIINECKMLNVLAFMFILIIAPVLLAFGYIKFIGSKFFMNNFNIQVPTAWDWYFSKRPICFIRIYLKDGNEVIGYFGENSYATSFPNDGNIYIEKVYSDIGNGLAANENSDGILIPKESYSLIEFYKIEQGGENESEQNLQSVD